MEQQRNKTVSIIYAILYLLLGASLGLCIVFTADLDKMLDTGIGSFLIWYGLYIFLFVIVLFAEIIIHESGHLVFGLLSGYRFLSFRIGSFMLLKREGKILFRKLKVAGTGGQCLMGPPEYRDGEYPYLLYNLGGCLMNLITSVLFFCLYLLLRNIPVLNTVLLCLVVCGIFYALLNGIPMQTKDVPNDGYNALRTGDSQEAKKSFWTQLKISEYNAEGKRMSDMPEELFFLPSDSNKTNAVVNSSAVFFENRLMSSRNYCDANIVCHQFLEGDYNLPGIHWNVLQCDRITTDILLENGKCTREGLMSKEAQDYFKKLQESLTVLRTKYIVSLFLGKDEKETDSYLQKFEKVAAHYPNEEDVLDERGLMKLLKEKLAAKTEQN